MTGLEIRDKYAVKSCRCLYICKVFIKFSYLGNSHIVAAAFMGQRTSRALSQHLVKIKLELKTHSRKFKITDKVLSQRLYAIYKCLYLLSLLWCDTIDL